jgi:hypothetical protein
MRTFREVRERLRAWWERRQEPTFAAAPVDEQLAEAVRLGDFDVATALLARGASPYRPAWRGASCMTLVCRRDDLAWCSFFLVRSRPRRASDLERPLLQASFAGQVEVVRALLAYGADPQRVLTGPDVSVFRIHGEVLRALVRAGGRPDDPTAEMLATRQALGDHPT